MYNKAEVDASLALKANQSTTYTKTQVDTSLALKADQATTYSLSHADSLLVTKVNPADITSAVNSLVDAAPGALNTLNELAAALGDDPNFDTTITNQIGAKANDDDVTTSLALKQNKFIIGEIPTNSARLFDLNATKFRGIHGGPGISDAD